MKRYLILTLAALFLSQQALARTEKVVVDCIDYTKLEEVVVATPGKTVTKTAADFARRGNGGFVFKDEKLAPGSKVAVAWTYPSATGTGENEFAYVEYILPDEFEQANIFAIQVESDSAKFRVE